MKTSQVQTKEISVSLNFILTSRKNKHHIKKTQVSLLSNRIQNDLIKAMAIYVKWAIPKEVREASILFIFLDETTDVSHIAQVFFCCVLCT